MVKRNESINNLLQRVFFVAIFLMVALSPLYVVRWTYLGQFPTTLLELLIWVVWAIWGIWEITQNNISLKRGSLFAPGVLFVIAGGMSVLVASETYAALGVFRAYIVEPFFIYVILYDVYTSLSAEGSQRLKLIIWAGLLLAAFWVSSLGIIQALFETAIVTPHQFDRAHAVFNNGNALSLFLGPIISIMIAKIVWKLDFDLLFNSKLEIFEYAVLVIAILASVLTFSTGGMLALSGVVALLFVGRFLSYQSLARLIIGGMFLASLAVLPLADALAPDWENPWDRQGGTEAVRLCVWQGTYHLLQDNWLFGTGLSGFKEEYSDRYVTCDAEPLEYPHNIFITVWVEMGALGLLAFVYVLLTSIRIVSAQRKYVIVGVFYLLLHGFVDVPYFKNDLALQFWILMWLMEVD